MPWDPSKPAGTDDASSIDDSVIENNLAVDSWANAITNGISAGAAAILQFVRAAATVVFKARNTGDSFDRIQVTADGKLLFGSGAAGADVGLSRTAADVLSLDAGDQVRVQQDPVDANDLARKAYVDALGGLLNAATDTVDVVNTATETTLYNFSVPGGTLGTDKGLRFILIGDLLKNDGLGTAAWSVRFYYGASNWLFWSRSPATNSAERQMFVLRIELHAKGATNLQVAWGHAATSSSQSGGTSFVDVNADPGYLGAWSYRNLFAVDSTVAQAFRVTAQWERADPNLSLRLLSARLERIR